MSVLPICYDTNYWLKFVFINPYMQTCIYGYFTVNIYIQSLHICLLVWTSPVSPINYTSNNDKWHLRVHASSCKISVPLELVKAFYIHGLFVYKKLQQGNYILQKYFYFRTLCGTYKYGLVYHGVLKLCRLVKSHGMAAWHQTKWSCNYMWSLITTGL